MDVKNARTEMGLSQQELGRLIGTHYITVSRWERGDRTPRPESVRFLEALLFLKDNHPDAYADLVERYVRT